MRVSFLFIVMNMAAVALESQESWFQEVLDEHGMFQVFSLLIGTLIQTQQGTSC